MAENSSGYVGFGYWRGCPPNIRIAWGARAILEGDGSFSFLHDRMDWNGKLSNLHSARTELADLINLAMPVVREAVIKLLRNGDMHMDKEREFVLLDEPKLKIIGNTNGSCGYLYLVAFSPE